MPVDAIVAGAGIWGCTLARRLAECGRRVKVCEARAAIGGNVRCEEIDGFEIHSYGSHIFHTHNPRVWSFVNRFASFNGYQHKVMASYGGKVYYLPLGLALINKFFGLELKPGEVEDFMKDESHSQAIFDAFFRGYTSKQWGRPPEEIDPSIIKRVPVRSNYDVNYFNDYWQGIPTEGFNALFANLLDHKNITVETNCPISLNDIRTAGVPVYYSGPIDQLFDYRYGALPWRSLRFETEWLNQQDSQGSSVVNYTEAQVPFTRIHEFKHYHPERQEVMTRRRTIIMREYPENWSLGDEPYYPIPSPESATLLSRYQVEASSISNLIIGGRLGSYRYYDMDAAMDAALCVNV